MPRNSNNNNSNNNNNTNNTSKVSKKANNNNNNNNNNNINNNNNNVNNNSNNSNINNAVKRIKAKNVTRRNNIIFILAIILIVAIIGIIAYFIYNKYPEIFSLDNQLSNLENQQEEKESLYERTHNFEENNNLDSSDVLKNIKNDTYKKRLKNNPQVFNISNNIFNYDDAEAVCKAHGSELATYQQVVDAYRNGAEWCNYGWSQNQMALYPMQDDTIKDLNQDPESLGMCGSAGVNGGYFENGDALFGVNCYGTKPEPKDRERTRDIPMSIQDRDNLEKIKLYKSNLYDFTINSYNKDLWSKK